MSEMISKDELKTKMIMLDFFSPRMTTHEFVEGVLHCWDATTVIRCKDCRFCYEYDNGEKICGNDEYEVTHIVTDEDFCSWAEKNEGEDR